MSLATSVVRRPSVRTLVFGPLASLVLVVAAAPGLVSAATLDKTSYSLSTTGAAASGSVARATAAVGNTYSIGFKLTDTGNDELPVYVKYRWSALVSVFGGLAWTTTATKTFFNRNGSGTSVTGTALMDQATLDTIARNAGSAVTAAKLKAEVTVCRDAATDNCSGWFSQTWNTYPDAAFGGIFECLQTTATVDIHTFVQPAYVPQQNTPFALSVVVNLVESSNATLSDAHVVSSAVRAIVYPSPFAIATQSFVYMPDGSLTNGYIGFGGLTPGKYYSVWSQIWVSSAGAGIVANEQPTYQWARYGIQNGHMGGEPGDIKCLAW